MRPGFYRFGDGEDGVICVGASDRLFRYLPSRFYRGYRIEYDPPPIPLRQFDYGFCHVDYDGPGDNRCGTGASVEDCKQQIDELIEEGEA